MRFTQNLAAWCLGLLSIGSAVPTTLAQDTNVKTVFLFKDVMQSNTTALKTSGFNALLLFRIGVLENGDLHYYSTGGAGEEVDVAVAINGEYTGGSALAERMVSLKTGETFIDRTEVSLVSHDATFRNILALINSEGTGPETRLYKNFKSLKEAWDVDAFNNDDESVYDVSSSVSFGLMLGEIGYKYTGAPYTRSTFWADVKNGLDAASPGLVDRMYLQCYDGGASNEPGTWQPQLGMKVIPILWVVNDAKPSFGHTPEQAAAKFERWYAEDGVAGGGYWNDYDIEKMGSSYTEYGDVLNEIFG